MGVTCGDRVNGAAGKGVSAEQARLYPCGNRPDTCAGAAPVRNQGSGIVFSGTLTRVRLRFLTIGPASRRRDESTKEDILMKMALDVEQAVLCDRDQVGTLSEAPKPEQNTRNLMALSIS
jgi:hypothetical protein